jgi:hypothetical protein
MKVLIAPLDWGLGHATRCIPVIKGYLAKGADVELATSGAVAVLYRSEFPDLVQHDIPSYGIRYPKRGMEMPLWLIKNLSRIAEVIEQEHERIEQIVSERHIQEVFSDNRFGCYSLSAKSIYMTHQLRIAIPFPFSFMECWGIRWHLEQMKHFSEIWVPDFPEFPGMAGRLSHVSYFPRPVKYVGLLSRFEAPVVENKDIDFLAIFSGPEPMRTVLEKKVMEILHQIPGNHAVLLGTPGILPAVSQVGNITLYSHLGTNDFAHMVARARNVVARPGYSTVMDMAKLGASCIFVPTPGQTEQVYLGKSLDRAGYTGLISQGSLSRKSLQKAAGKKYCIPELVSSEPLLSLAIDLAY